MVPNELADSKILKVADRKSVISGSTVAHSRVKNSASINQANSLFGIAKNDSLMQSLDSGLPSTFRH